MNEHDFLTSITASPDDSAPRLIFADWLEERGDPRATLIRLLCELTGRIDVENRAAKENALLELTGICDGPVTAVQTNSLGMKFVLIPPGEFLMGSETDRYYDKGPVSVSLTQGFWLAETQVTQAVFHSVVGAEPWKRRNHVKEGPGCAASYINWDDAMEFCAELTTRERAAGHLPAGWEYRLPTEAEWEYACRAGTTTAYYFGDDASELSDYGWWGGFIGNGNAKDEQYAHRVGQKKPNAWGLYDMHGNVWEWCSDWYGEYSGGSVTDPTGADTGSDRVNRGGGWYGFPRSARSANRSGSE